MKMSRLLDAQPLPNAVSYAQFERVFGRRFEVAIAQRYDTILDAARDVFARRGFRQASIREIAHAAGMSLAGLYHYVGGKDEMLFLILDRALDTLLTMLDASLAEARTAEARLHALVRTHLEFAFKQAHDLKLINRDWDQVAEASRAEILAKRNQYLERALAVLRDLDPHARSGDALMSATNLLLGMLNGIATRPFVRSREDARTLADEVSGLFLYGFLQSCEARHDV